MRKLIKNGVLMLIISLAPAHAALRDEAMQRCQVRLNVMSDLIETNREVQFLFSGFISAMMALAAQQGKEITPEQIMAGLAKRMYDVCLSQELPKVES